MTGKNLTCLFILWIFPADPFAYIEPIFTHSFMNGSTVPHVRFIAIDDNPLDLLFITEFFFLAYIQWMVSNLLSNVFE